MNYEFYQHKKKDRVKWIIVFTALILLSTSVIGVATDGFTNKNPYGWFTETKEPETPSETTEKAELTATAYSGSIIRLSATNSRASTGPDGSVQITATVTPVEYYGQLNWGITWVDPTSTFASGKTVTDYISFTFSGNTATVSLKKPFGEQIRVIVSSSNNAEVKAECLIDYRQKLNTTSHALSLDEPAFLPMYDIYNDMISEVNLVGASDAESMCMLYHNQRFATYFYPESVYTLKNETLKYRYIISPTQEFHTALVNAGLAEGEAPVPYEFPENYDITPAEMLNALGCGKLLPTSFEDEVDADKLNAFNIVANEFNGNVKAFDMYIEVTTDSGNDTIWYGINFNKDSTPIYPVDINLNENHIIL